MSVFAVAVESLEVIERWSCGVVGVDWRSRGAFVELGGAGGSAG